MKLIILNGSPAAGKSTVAERLHRDMPMSLLADIDTWRKCISNWRENREESLKYAYIFSLSAIDAYLETGNSVVVDKAILSDNTVIDSLIEIGKKHGAEVYEFILTADREVIVQRAEERGFHENGLLTPQRVLELWETTQNLIQARPQAVVIDTTHNNKDEVYENIKKIV